jgi:hypothetical protein
MKRASCISVGMLYLKDGFSTILRNVDDYLLENTRNINSVYTAEGATGNRASLYLYVSRKIKIKVN